MTTTGYDQSAYPGDSWMQWLRSDSPIAVTGFYLAPAPYHSDTSWMPTRARLAAAGWGFLPVFVGLQDGASSLSGSRGTTDGQSAASLMRSAGFASGSTVFLDIETGGPISGPFEAYIDAWVAAADGAGFTPGIYCSHNLISWAQPKVSRIWSFHIPDAGGQTFDPGNLPTGSIDAGAVATQYRQNVYLEGYAHAAVDLNVCAAADPSRP
ncbi:MAG: DUF1906 domain-containing protein [Caulobacter sp.]|nr:DUF1906 domain-containing protein [Caulobacter sp.]